MALTEQEIREVWAKVRQPAFDAFAKGETTWNAHVARPIPYDITGDAPCTQSVDVAVFVRHHDRSVWCEGLRVDWSPR